MTPTWMPDGQRILYSTGDDLYIARDNGTESRKFATLPGRAFWLRWSPDGSRLRFTLLNSETHTSMLWEVSVDGSGAHMLLENWNSAPSAECCGSWTDDGRYYVFQSARDGEQQHLGDSGTRRVVRTSGCTRSHHEWAARLSGADYRARRAPDFLHRTCHPVRELLRYDAAARIFVPFASALSNARRVEFSRDKAWVAWIRQDDRSLWRSRPDGSALLQLTARPIQVFTMQWSADDRQIVLMGRQPGKPWKIYTMDTDGGHFQEVLNEDRSEADADWSPDGKTLVFGRLPDLMAEAAQPKAIYTVDLATRTMTKLPGPTACSARAGRRTGNILQRSRSIRKS